MHLPARHALPVAALSVCLVAASLALAPSVGAAEPDPQAEPATAPVRRSPPSLPRQSPVRLEHHGILRFRPQLILGGDLGLGRDGSSPIPPPIAATTGDDPDASALRWADLRLRWEPTLHLGDSLSVHVGLDLVDGLVLGSTWTDASGVPMAGLTSDAAAPQSAGDFGWDDALQVRALYGRWLAFDMFEVIVGRVPDHFGLGLVRNDGLCPDCDFGSVVDMASVAFTISGFRIQGTWEYTATGATTDLALAAERQSGGQPKDLGLSDDVSTYTLRAGRFPVSPVELEARRVALDERREWAIDWALFSSFTDQTLSSMEQIESTSLECRPEEELANGQPVQPYHCIRLFRRGAFIWRPGLWLRAERRPDMLTSLRVELEAGGLFGEIDHPQRLLEADALEAKDFAGFGAALEVEWRRDTLALGVDVGLATGDDGEFVGVLDGQNVVDPDDDAWATNDVLRKNRTITSYMFARDYHLDLILFRQVLGAVTNAFYLKPWVSTAVLDTEETRLTLRLDALYAIAMRPSGTPADGDQWGIEVDARALLELRSGFRASLEAGVLVPLDALNHPTSGATGDPAFTIRSVLGWQF
ncbi:MAG: hypothetical protein IT385_05925 [Deltaproteobacteria bacterium]|nr:hypothetical protein [Deltaproteobacteria bacterium]